MKINTLHIEHDKYAYYDVEGQSLKILLIHDVEEEEVHKFVSSLRAKLSLERDYVVLVDKNKSIAFDNTEKLSEVLQQSQIAPKSMEYKITKLPDLPNITIPTLIERYSHNPHQNSKSRNCKIRRR